MQTVKQFRCVYWFAVILVSEAIGSLRVFSQDVELRSANPTRSSFTPAPATGSDATKLGIARFASNPILPISEGLAELPSRIELGGKKQKPFLSESMRDSIPTILQDVKQLDVSLDFLILTSLTSRKTFASFNGGVTIDTSTTLDYAISEQVRQFALSQFDPNFAAFLIGNDINQPGNSFFGPGLRKQNKIDETEFNARFSKSWENGLISSIGYEPSLAYLYFPQGNPDGFNPTHSSDLVVRLEQPLMRGRGRDVNLVNVRIAESRAMQSQYQIEASLQSQLRSIEQVYWRLHAEHVRLKAIDGAIGLAQKIVDVVQARFESDRVIYADVARARVKLEDLFQQRLSAELALRYASFDLAQLAGLELNESVLLVPTEQPEHRPPGFDYTTVVNNAIAFNPNLRKQRQELEVRRQNIVGSKNLLLPKMNMLASHRSSGLDNDLGSSLQQMASYRFSDYSLGIQYTQQLGTRQATSQLETAKLQSSRELAILEALERKVGFEVMQSLNELKQIFERYTSALRQVDQSKKWVDIARVRYEDPPLSISRQESLLVLLSDYQTALQAQIDSLVLVARSLADYNGAIALIDEKRGALLSKWKIGSMTIDSEVIEQQPMDATMVSQSGTAKPVIPPKAQALKTEGTNKLEAIGTNSRDLKSENRTLSSRPYIPPLPSAPR